MSIVFSDGLGPFPPIDQADDNGLLAIGGTLAIDRLLHAYRCGIFPWYSEDEPICWYAPPVRLVLFPHDFRISKSFKKILETHPYRISMNEDFQQVIHACASIGRKDGYGTWIVRDMIDAYTALHGLGYANSVEVWDGDRLIGGLYGVQIGDIFCGESMFSMVSNTSKIALHHLTQLPHIQIIDCQVTTAHLQRLGAVEITRNEFMKLLSAYGK